jgi:hypothetical protein
MIFNFLSFSFRKEYKYLSDSKNKFLDERLKVMCIAGIKKLKYNISKSNRSIQCRSNNG